MYDDKGEGEETRAVLPSSHSWRAPTPIHRLSLLPFVRFYPPRTERVSAYMRACVYEGARVLARASCLRALCGGCVCVHTRVRSCAFLYAYASVRVRARAWNRYMLSSFLFFSPFRFWRFFPSSSRVCLSPCRKGDA